MKWPAMCFVIIAGVGCGQPQVCDWCPREAKGVGVKLDALADRLKIHGVMNTEGDVKDAAASFQEQFDWVTGNRVASPEFRTLCCALNRVQGNWERIVIVECFSFEGDEPDYGFALAVLANGSTGGCTNMRRDNGRLQVGQEVRAIAPVPATFRDQLAELDKAGKTLPPRVLYNDAIEAQLYIVHDIRRDGSDFSFGIWGWPAEEALPCGPPDYARAAEMIMRDMSPQPSLWDSMPASSPASTAPAFVSRHSSRGRELALAGEVYAHLMAQTWHAVLGRP